MFGEDYPKRETHRMTHQRVEVYRETLGRFTKTKNGICGRDAFHSRVKVLESRASG